MSTVATSLLNLPDELLLQIGLETDGETILALRRTNRRLRRICCDHTLATAFPHITLASQIGFAKPLRPSWRNRAYNLFASEGVLGISLLDSPERGAVSRSLLVWTRYRFVELWSIADDGRIELVRQIGRHEHEVLGACSIFYDEQQHILSWDKERTVKLWHDQDCIHTWSLPGKSELIDLESNGNGFHAKTDDEDYFWNTEEYPLQSNPFKLGYLRRRGVVSMLRAGNIHWRVNPNGLSSEARLPIPFGENDGPRFRESHPYNSRWTGITALEWGADSNALAAFKACGTIRIWPSPFSTCRIWANFKGHSKPVKFLQPTDAPPHGHYVSLCEGGQLCTWSLATYSVHIPSSGDPSYTYSQTHTIRSRTSRITGIESVTIEGRRLLLSWCEDGTLQLWDVGADSRPSIFGVDSRPRLKVLFFGAHTKPVLGAHLVAFGSKLRVMSWARDGTVLVWNPLL